MKEKASHSRQIKAADTKNRIYECAKYLFENNGFNDVSIDDIVTRAKVAKGSFYVYYKSKDELVSILINEYVTRIDLDYEAYLKSLPNDKPVDEALLSLIGEIADVITHTVGYDNMKILYKTYLTNSTRTRSATDYNRKLYGLFHDMITKGMEQHVFCSDLSAEELARYFVAAFRGLTLEWCIRYPDFNLKEQATGHFKILVKGIKAS